MPANTRAFVRIASTAFVCLAAFGQTANQLPAFEAALIKPPPPPEMGARVIKGMFGGPGTRDPGLMTAESYSLSNLVASAYNLESNYRISGPDWMKTTEFNITARVPAGATKEQFRLMLQNLLAERFGLKLHVEKNDMPGYDLVVAKNGPHLKPSGLSVAAADDDAPPGARAPLGPPAGLGQDGFPIIPPGSGISSRSVAGRNRENWVKESMEQFSSQMWFHAGRPVKDATGLKGEFDFSLYWVRDCPACSDGNGELAVLPPGPDFAAALEQQLGLKLVPSKTQVDILVIDHIEKTPTAN